MAQWLFDSDRLKIRRPNEPDLGAGPPFDFPGVSLLVFPLRANVRTLRRFCGNYLNVVPPEVAEFRPALPLVYLLVLDYGRMAVEERNLGWIPQREVVFSVPLEWHRRGEDRHRFVDWATCSPFIYVDHPLSLVNGREVFGWPKMLCRLSLVQEGAIANPRGRQRLLSLNTVSLEERNRDEHTEGRRLLEIDYELPPGPTTLPPDLWSSFNPLRSIPAALMGAWSLVPDLLEIWLPTALRGWAPRSPRNLVDMTATLCRNFSRLSRGPEWNIFNLKQSPDADHPEKACYQALVQSRMTLERFNRGGFFGDLKLLQGDPSGGVRIRLHADRAHPILESLGLEAGKERQAGNAVVATLFPVLPFWLEADLGYGSGETLCWRTRDSGWYQGRLSSRPLPHRRRHDVAWFNTMGSGSLQALAGPLTFRDVSLTLFPLLADREKLDFVHSYLGFDERAEKRFEAWGNVVYLIVAHLRGIRAEKSSLGELCACDLGFWVPVKQIWKEKEGWGLVCPFGFCDSPLHAVLDRELLGRPVSEATFKQPPGPWPPGGDFDAIVLAVRTNVFPALGVGMGSEERTIVEICKEKAVGPAPKIAAQAEREKCERIEDALQKIQDSPQKILCELRGKPIPLFTLKQIRDAEEPDRACFQAIVRTDYFLDDLLKAEKPLTGSPYQVRVHRYPSQPIVDLLGLEVQRYESTPSLPGAAGEGAEIAVLQPCSPFTLRLAMRRTSGKEIFQQASARPWLDLQTIEEGWPSLPLF